MKKLLIALMVFCLIVVGGCSKKEEPVTPTSEPKVVKETQEPVVETKEPEVETKEAQLSFKPLFAERRPLTFMVNNDPKARPQSGWNLAKIIYEITIESKHTRYLFVTDSTEGTVGPIRSARPAFFWIAAEYRGVYGHCGNYKFVKDSGVEKYIKDWDEFTWPGYFRSKDRYAPHNLYAQLDKIYQKLEEKGISSSLDDLLEKHWQVYDEEKVYSGGESANSIKFSYNDREGIEYRYDADKKAYEKYIGGQVQIDKETGETVLFTNLIIIPRVQSKMPNGIHEKIEYTGKDQKAIYYVQGQKFDVTYTKENVQDPMKFTIQGEELILNPGLTMINVVPEGTKIGIQ